MRRMVIRGGTVVSVDAAVGDFRVGDVLIEGSKIVAVGADLSGEHADEVLDAEGMIVMPGFVDTHRHLWQTGTRGDSMDQVFLDLTKSQRPRIAAHYTPEDVYDCVLAGAADALDRGVTTVLDWCHIINTPDHAEADIRALRDSGIRALFAYGSSMAPRPNDSEGVMEAGDMWQHARQVRRQLFADPEDRLTFALALPGPEATTMEITAADIAVGRELGVPMSMHVGTPEGRPSSSDQSIKKLAEAGMLGADMNFVHCCATTAAEFELLAAAGGTATACPSADMAMGMGTPATGRIRAAGVRVALGTDSVIAASGDMFDEMRAALWAERAIQAQRVYASGSEVMHTADLHFSTKDALEAATINGAHACWLADRVGSLTPGKRADVILVRATDSNLWPVSDVVATLVGCGSGLNVDTVLVDGEFVKRDGQLTRLDIREVRAGLASSRDRLYAMDNYPGIRPLMASAGNGETRSS